MDPPFRNSGYGSSDPHSEKVDPDLIDLTNGQTNVLLDVINFSFCLNDVLSG